MRVHLDYPFNARFSRFIEVVNMTGADFVRLSEKDLARLCDGEGPHLYDLATFQQSLRPPVSPHVRDIFSLPPSPKLPQKPPDLCDPVSDLEFDFSEEQCVSSFDNKTSECSDPSSPSLPDQGRLSDAMTDDDASDDGSLASLPVQSLPFFTAVSSSLDAKPHDAESLIDLFSPLPPLPLSELDDSYSSDGTLSPDSRRMIHDVFDSPHLSTLSPLASPYHSDVEDEVDLLGLGLPSNEATAAKPGEISIYSPIFSDVDFADGHEALDALPAVQETPRLFPTLPNDPPPLDIGQSFSPEHPRAEIDPCQPEVRFEGWAHCPDGGTDVPAEENPTRLPIAVDLENGQDPYPPADFPSPEKWQKSLPTGEFHLSTSPPPLSEDHELDPAYEFHANLDEEDPESGGAAGLSAFMSDLRSLDSSPPLSPHFDTPYTLSQVFSDRQILSGGSLGLSVSPELTIIETPVTSAYGDDVLIASPSTTTYHAHGPYHFDSEQVVLKHLAVGSKDSALSAPPSPPAARESAPARRPKIEVIIPSLPSLLEDEQLSSLMSSIELAKFKSRNGSRSSLVEPSHGPPWHTAGGLSSQDRSIWPLSSSVERFLPSPYMKDPDAMSNRSPTIHRRRRGEEAPPPSAIGTAPGLQRTKSLGTVSEDLTEALAELTGSEGAEKDVAAQSHKRQPSGSTGWCKVGEYFRTMLSPVGADLASEEDRGHAGDTNDGAPVPGGWAL
ncbi:hypothetical protein EST38_g9624 [Candolleomyces aberdarensis]|uniref:Uncharacterized protein n=1 Tax=Candolleomyces aberdarensis TaxID=2316362 RepID=A0A4Q2D9G2_9AGAR|nr:hypothetical protein EST38_g9624 [Candolleomyces aberdarensis]